MSKTKPIGFISEIRKILASDQDFTPLDRETLTRLADDPVADAAWKHVRKVCGPWADVVIHMVVWEILGARKLALATKQQPNYGEYSKKAKCLAALVRYSDAFLVPLPNVSNEELSSVLDAFALRLQDLDQKSLLRVSRCDKNGSRERTIFMRLLGQTFHEWCGHWCDAAVADFTDILFQKGLATVDSVRSSRRPKTTKGRSGRPKLAA